MPAANQMIENKGVSVLTVAGFFAEVGDLRQYKDPRQIIKLAGLNLKMNQYGLFKRKTTITKRGRKRLRSLLYQVARPLSIHNDGFRFSKLHAYYCNRASNPLTGKQSFIALARKLIKFLYAIGTRGCAFSDERMLKDIPFIHNAQEVA